MDHPTEGGLAPDRFEGVRRQRSDAAFKRQIGTDDRIGEALQIAAARLGQQTPDLTDLVHARIGLERAAARIAAIARLHRTLCRPQPRHAVELAAYLDPFRSQLAKSIGVRLDLQMQGVTLPGPVAARIGIVICEMATEAVRHPPPDATEVVLTIEAVTTGPGDVRLRLYEEGPGYLERSGPDAAGTAPSGIASTIAEIGGHARVVLPFGAGATLGAWLEIVLPAGGIKAA